MSGRVTQKSDVYEFGVVLLELLTGREKFDRTMPRGQQFLPSWVCFVVEIHFHSFLHLETSHACSILEVWWAWFLSSCNVYHVCVCGSLCHSSHMLAISGTNSAGLLNVYVYIFSLITMLSTVSTITAACFSTSLTFYSLQSFSFGYHSVSPVSIITSLFLRRSWLSLFFYRQHQD